MYSQKSCIFTDILCIFNGDIQRLNLLTTIIKLSKKKKKKILIGINCIQIRNFQI